MGCIRIMLVFLALALALPVSASALVIGVGDETANMFSDPYFKALHVQEARIVVSWDVATSRAQADHRAALALWLTAGRRTTSGRWSRSMARRTTSRPSPGTPAPSRRS
jgi:hypothetical protein